MILLNSVFGWTTWQQHVGDLLSVLLSHSALPVFLKDTFLYSTQILPIHHFILYTMSSSEGFHTEENLIHPIETFQHSSDYPQFESTVIWPFLRAAREWATLFSETDLDISTAPGHPSIEDIFQFLDETNYNHGLDHTRNNSSLPGNLTILPHPSPFVHWWDTSAKSTQTASCLKEGSLRRVLKLFLVPVGGWQGYWGSVDWERTML